MLNGEIERYLQETLGWSVSLQRWAKFSDLPYYLQDAYEFSIVKILDGTCIVMIALAPRSFSLGDTRKHLEKVASIAGLPVIFATDVLTSYERRFLIEHKVPFIVPGNQLYLPDLRLDLREHFRIQRVPLDKPLSPATQAILIAALLRPWQSEWHPIEVAARFGYTAMTISRAAKELTSSGIATAINAGRCRRLRMDHSPAEIWERARPLMRNPAKKIAWTYPLPELVEHSRLAGMSALARYSMLAEPRIPVHAISQERWKLAQQQGIQLLPEPTSGAIEWQIWSYNPALIPDRPTVDPLSLILNLQDIKDDRVELALGELKEQLPW